MKALTNTTSVELIYSTKIMVPLHIQRYSMKFVALINLPLSKYKRNKLIQVDFLDEMILQATTHAYTYQKRIARLYLSKKDRKTL